MAFPVNKHLLEVTKIDASEYHKYAHINDTTPLSDEATADAKQVLKHLISLKRLDVRYELRPDGEQYLEFMHNGIVQCVRLMISTKSSRVVYMKLVVDGFLNYYRLTFSVEVTNNYTYDYIGPDSGDEGYINEEDALDIWVEEQNGR